MDVVELLGNLIEIRSVNDPSKGEKAGPECAKYIRDYLIDKGLPAEIIESNGYYSVYGILGKGSPIILLMAHYDTVPVVPEEWSYDPFKLTIVEGKGYGRGVTDDKGNIASIIIALTRLKDRVKDFTLIYAFTGDEEIGGRNGAKVIRDMLLNNNLRPDYVINGDGIGLNIIIRRRCIFKTRIRIKELKVKIRGVKHSKTFRLRTPIYKTGHAAYFTPGVDTHPFIEASYYQRVNNLYVSRIQGSFVKSNVLPSWVKVDFVSEDPKGNEIEVDENLTKILRALLPLSRCNIESELFSEYGVTITPNYYVYKNNEHILELDIRAMTTNVEKVKETLENTLRNLEVDAELEVEGGTGYLYTPKDSKIVNIALNTLKDLGIKPKVVELLGASDSRYYSTLGIECIDIGPIGGNVHGPNEYVELWSLYKLVEFYQRMPLALRV